MTNPGDSDEWWKQYGGQGVSPDSGSQGSVPQYPTSDQSAQPAQPSAPQYPQQPQYGQSQPQQPYPSQPQPYPSQPQQSYPGYQQPYPAQPGPGYPGAYQPYGQRDSGSNGLAIASLIVSLIGLCSCIGSIVGIVLGVMSLNQIKERGGEGKGMAQAGIWIGVAGIVIWVAYLVFVLVASASGV